MDLFNKLMDLLFRKGGSSAPREPPCLCGILLSSRMYTLNNIITNNLFICLIRMIFGKLLPNMGQIIGIISGFVDHSMQKKRLTGCNVIVSMVTQVSWLPLLHC